MYIHITFMQYFQNETRKDIISQNIFMIKSSGDINISFSGPFNK